MILSFNSFHVVSVYGEKVRLGLVAAIVIIMLSLVVPYLCSGGITERVVPLRLYRVEGVGTFRAVGGDAFSSEAPNLLFVFWTIDIVPSPDTNYVDSWCTQLPNPELSYNYNTTTLVWEMRIRFYAPVYRTRYTVLAQCDGDHYSDDESKKREILYWSGTIGGLSPYLYILHVEPINVSNANYSLVAQIVKPCLLYTSPSPRDLSTSRMPSSA